MPWHGLTAAAFLVLVSHHMMVAACFTIWAVAGRLAESGALLLSAQVTEVAAVRKGLLGLRQNVLLLQDDADPDKFYPRCVPL
jgi:hypothetical protein